MGYKAEIKLLQNNLELKNRQLDIFYATLKQIVLEHGEYKDDAFELTVKEFDVFDMNHKYAIVTEPTEDGLKMRVERKD